MDSKEISDTLKEAQEYLNRLESLQTDLQNARDQVKRTFEDTEKNIKEVFSNLKTSLIDTLNKRESHLLVQAQKIKNESLKPLEECHCIIKDKSDFTNKLINSGNTLSKEEPENFDDFIKNASRLGSLPEVPDLIEVPFISFHCDANTELDVKNILLRFGEVYKIAPVQITEVVEKPGALLVEWHCIECDDRMTDVQEFRLQRAFGDVLKDKYLEVNFKDCYKGLEMQHLVKELQPGQPYSFRVCCKFEGMPQWTPWSLPRVACTNLKPFTWEAHADFSISGENKIAKPIGTCGKILFSDGPQFLIGHSVEFTFLEVDPGESDAVIGLIIECLKKSSFSLTEAVEGTFLIYRNGKIRVDGIEKSTILSEFSKGLKICFGCDLTNKHKVRVNIDSNEKRVTYDWTVDPNARMYFAAQFTSPKWKIMVE